MSRVQAGDPAPDVELALYTGQTVSLKEYRGEHPVVLYFYPMDGTPVCTKQACAFRDAYEQFAEAGAVVIGVSGDSPQSHRSFADRHRLPFLLATDKDRALRRAFGVPKTLGMLPGRVTYVIDREGIVRHVFRSALGADRHVTEALEVVRNLAGPKEG